MIAFRFTSGPWGDSKAKRSYFFDSIRGKGSPGMLLWVLGLVFFVMWMLSGLYVVGPDEEGVETRFGKYTTTTLAGLHYHMPSPIEDVRRIRVTSVQRLEVGYRSTSHDRYMDKGMNQDGLLLTKDENIVDVNFEIQWKVKNAVDYIFNFRESEVDATVRYAAESAVREVIGGQDMSTLLEGDGRALLSDDLHVLLQGMFDYYNMGLHVVSIQFKKVDPPVAVIDAFRDVQSARADKERAVNMAHAYANDIIPRARGEAAALMNDALAYKEEAINGAIGETNRFIAVYNQYKTAKEMTREKIYIETMSKILSGMDKVIIDNNKGNGPVYYLPLQEALRRGK